jgi:predicted DNA-binding transcriptional regulator AlpA
MSSRLLNEVEAARLLGMSIAWMQWKRWKGGGPAFVKFGRAVRYEESDLAAYIDAHAGNLNTSALAFRADSADQRFRKARTHAR